VSRFAYIFLLLFLAFSVVIRLYINKPQSLPRNTDLKFEATVKNEPKIYDTGQVIAVADAKIYTGLYPRYRVGDRIVVSGKINDSGKMFQAKVEKIGDGGGLSAFLGDFRDKISGNINSLMGVREATLISGAVLGVDSIGQQFHDELVKTGTIHVVVVSGQNLMIVAGIFMALAPYIGRKKSVALATFAVFAYAFITGFEPPVLRAGLMVLVTTLALYFGRETNVLWTMGIAGALIIFMFPQSLFEVSFQLTFAASFGIVTLGKYLEGAFRGPVIGTGPAARFPRPTSSLEANFETGANLSSAAAGARRGSPTRVTRSTFGSLIGESLIQNAAIATSAYLFTAPIIIFYFGRISPIAPIANILVAEAVFPMMILGFATAILSLIFMPLAQVLAYFAFVPAFYFSQVVRIFAALPFAQYSFGQGNWILAIGIYLILFNLLWITRVKRY